jgi:hypothetical protein
METTPRRSSRLKNLEAKRAEAELLHQQTSQAREPRKHHSHSNKPASKLLELPTELLTLIFSHLLTTKRPFLIGRCQEERRRKTEGSPRDTTAYTRSKFNSRRHLGLGLSEALPLWYSLNRFWLIHNEFQSDDDDAIPNPARGFDAWISQTPRGAFDFMENVSLCGYACWPNRCMITLDLKNRRLVGMRHYSIYGHELPIYQQIFYDSAVQALAGKAEEDRFAALRAVLVEKDCIFQISKFHVSSPPGRLKGTPPAVGWEYDW